MNPVILNQNNVLSVDYSIHFVGELANIVLGIYDGYTGESILAYSNSDIIEEEDGKYHASRFISAQYFKTGGIYLVVWKLTSGGLSYYAHEGILVFERNKESIDSASIGAVQVKGKQREDSCFHRFDFNKTIDFSTPYGGSPSADYDFSWHYNMSDSFSKNIDFFHAENEIIAGWNDKICFEESLGAGATGEVVATIVAGAYLTIAGLTAAINNALDTDSPLGRTYTVTRDVNTKKWTISANTGATRFFWKTGTIPASRRFAISVVGADLSADSGLISDHILDYACNYPGFTIPEEIGRVF